MVFLLELIRIIYIRPYLYTVPPTKYDIIPITIIGTYTAFIKAAEITSNYNDLRSYKFIKNNNCPFHRHLGFTLFLSIYLQTNFVIRISPNFDDHFFQFYSSVHSYIHLSNFACKQKFRIAGYLVKNFANTEPRR